MLYPHQVNKKKARVAIEIDEVVGYTMDRTSDFVKITVLFDTGAHKPQAHRPLSQDARRAQQIADQLRQQELFLRDLQDLVTKKSIIGDDPTAQIATLTDVLKKELAGIEKNIQLFQQAINTAQQGRSQGNHRAHFSVITQSLKSRCAKNAKQFHVALQQHTATIRERSTRRSKFSHGGAGPMVQLTSPLFSRTPSATPQANANANPFRRPEDPARAPLLNTERQPNSNGEPLAMAPQMGNGMPAAPLAGPVGLRRRQGNLGASPFMQQQKPMTPGGGGAGYGGGQQAMQHFSRQDANARFQNAQHVESTIVEITGMYTRMATMVAEQGEIISRIDDDMDVAQSNVEASHSELLKLYSMVSGNRSLIIKLFIVVLLVIFLFVVIF